MKYELSYFDDFIHHRLHEVAAAHITDQSRLETELAALRTAMQDVRHHMRRNSCSGEHPEELRTYIRQHQNALTILADDLDDFMEMNKDRVAAAPRFTELCSFAFDCIESLGSFIETYFTPWFDQDVRLPKRSMTVRGVAMLNEINELLSGLGDRGIDDGLVEVCRLPFEEPRTNSSYTFSSRRMVYLNTMMQELREIRKSALEGAQLKEQLLRVLLYLNFNSYRFFQYCKQECRRRLALKDTAAERAHLLQWYLAKLESFQTRPGLALRTNRGSLKEQIAAWLQSELDTYPALAGGLPAAPAEQSAEKLRTTLTVPMMGHLLRLMVDAGIVENVRILQLLRLFAGGFSTRHAPNISLTSLKNHYYESDRPTAVAVRELLHKMIASSRKEYPG